MLTNDQTILGTLSTGEGVPLMQADRRRHVYVIGMTGTGKTGLQINLMLRLKSDGSWRRLRAVRDIGCSPSMSPKEARMISR